VVGNLVQGSGFGIWYLGFRFWYLGVRVRVSGLGSRVQGLGVGFRMVADFFYRPGGDPGANGWFLLSTPIQMPPRRGVICGRLTLDLLSTRLQGGLG